MIIGVVGGGDGDGHVGDAVVPAGGGGAGDGDESLEDGAVALEAAAEADLPDAVPGSDAALGLLVGELVPDGGAGDVAEAVEGHVGGLAHGGGEAEGGLHGADDGLAAGVDADVVEGVFEAGDVVGPLR